MKDVSEIKPNYGPVYCAAIYPALCTVFQRCGYALAVHGSLARDFDLIAIPWVESALEPEQVLAAISEDKIAFTFVGKPTQKLHNRIAYTMCIGFGECACDLSFMPKVGQ